LKWLHYVILLLLLLCLIIPIIWTNLFSSSNSFQFLQQKEQKQNASANTNLHLRPVYLTDDGTESEDNDEDTEEGGTTQHNTNEDKEGQQQQQQTESSSSQYEEEKVKHEEEEEEEEKEFEEEEGDDIEGEVEKAEVEKEKLVHRAPSLSRRQRRRRRLQHKIPRNLVFTHYKNLLDLLPPFLSIHNNKEKGGKVDIITEEELALAMNVQHSIDVHNRSSSKSESELPLGRIENVYFFTDKECIESLKRIRPGLISYFINETEGMYKADICRGSALYEYGGFYLDVDVGVRHDLWNDLSYETEFVTAKVHQQSNWINHFFQAILGTTRHNIVLKRYLELFEKHYDGTDPVTKGPLGVILLKRAWDQVRNNEYNNNQNQNKQQQDYINNVRRRESNSNTQQQKRPVTELYQEILYNKDVFSDLKPPAPTWGKRRACHFLVAGIANNPSNVELSLQQKEKNKNKNIGLQIPVLSRIPGSRMCVEGKGIEEEDSTDNKANKIDIDSLKWWERM